eukprot:1136821-Prorocentrum_minimum.AAC.2
MESQWPISDYQPMGIAEIADNIGILRHWPIEGGLEGVTEGANRENGRAATAMMRQQQHERLLAN